jgi:hypothetical protein
MKRGWEFGDFGMYILFIKKKSPGEPWTVAVKKESKSLRRFGEGRLRVRLKEVSWGEGGEEPAYQTEEINQLV